MKNIIKYILVSIFVMTVSCEIIEPLDEIEPQYKLVEDNLFTDITKTEAALNGVYASWRLQGYNPPNVLSLAGYYTYRFTTDFSSHDYDYSHGTVKNIYQMYYTMIQRANFVIDAMQTRDIPGLTDERRTVIEAEATILRAIAHFSLLEYYGQFYDVSSVYGIPLMLEATRDLVQPARNTVQETYDAILADLEFGIANADAITEHHYMSKTTAKAYKAKTLFYMQKFPEAASVALEVMNDPHYALEDTYKDVFLNGYKSREVLFSPSSSSWDDYNNVTQDFYSAPDRIIAIADAEVGLPDDGNDTTGEGYDKRYAFAEARDNVAMYHEAGSQGRRSKYPFYASNTPTQKNSLFVLRTAEIYLIYAEAKARLGSGVDADALAALNTIRERAEMPAKNPTTKEELLATIRTEKILEFFCEWNQEWFDIVRYHYWDGNFDASTELPTISSDHLLTLPIPKSAFAANSSLFQNPGYEGPQL